MTHEFSLETHKFLSEKIMESQAAMTAAEKAGERSSAGYYRGKLEEYDGIRQLIAESIDLGT
ncbi:MAG: hypothetical protein GY866_19510 [Proteobacteria bacterium]|nr:hypothetical protein [Pseudomonadota bacterium]